MPILVEEFRDGLELSDKPFDTKIYLNLKLWSMTKLLWLLWAKDLEDLSNNKWLHIENQLWQLSTEIVFYIQEENRHYGFIKLHGSVTHCSHILHAVMIGDMCEAHSGHAYFVYLSHN